MRYISIPFFLIILFFLACQGKEEAAVRPNIVIMLADDQGWGDLSISGNPIVQTSNIDALGKTGAVLENFYVNSVCSPTRAELLTGRYHVRGGVYSTSQGGERLDLEEGTIAEAFKNAGYKTAAFGKWHNGMQYPYHPNGRGFDHFYGYCSGHWGSYFDAMLEQNGEIMQSKGYLTDVLTDKAIAYIQENKESPFLVYLPFNTPHSPMQVPDKWFDKFKDTELPTHRYSAQENIEKTKAAYAMAENIDWNVGKITTALEDLQLLDNTIIIYFSDNGPNGFRWNNNMKGQKGHTDEGGVRSPFLIKWGDKITGGLRVPFITHVIDLFPTLVELTGIKASYKNPLDGISLKSVLLGEEANMPDRILYNYWRNQLSLRNQQFRLDKDNALFDMEEDKEQRIDVSTKYPIIHQKLIQAKKEWEETVLIELPAEDNRTFPVGHADAKVTQLPARDAKIKGAIKRSNRWPNCSFYTNWTALGEEIFWEVEVLSTGQYQAAIYYTCSEENIGSTLQLSSINDSTSVQVTIPYDPPLRGMEQDRIERGESYVKDWTFLEMGPLLLEKGVNRLTLKATNITGKEVMDFRMALLYIIK